MYIITDNDACYIANDTQVLEKDNFVKLVNKNVVFPQKSVNLYFVDFIPANVETYKYCYRKDEGFYPNPFYFNNYGVPTEILMQIQQDTIDNIINEVSK